MSTTLHAQGSISIQASHLLPEVPVDDQLLAHAQRVAQRGCLVAAAAHHLLQLVEAPGLQGNTHCLVKLAVLAAPAGGSSMIDTKAAGAAGHALV
jgi:hypothetical protein